MRLKFHKKTKDWGYFGEANTRKADWVCSEMSWLSVFLATFLGCESNHCVNASTTWLNDSM